MSDPPPAPLLTLRGIGKSFLGVRVLDDVDLDVAPGEVHAVVGENGAGKSTLMKIVSGGYAPDEGTVEFAGEPGAFRGPRDAQRAGVGIIHQEFNLLPERTVAENVYLGHEPVRRGLVDRRAMLDRTTRLLASIGETTLPADARVGQLGVAQQQVVEIAKALALDARLLIMDEPTAALADHEVELLYGLVRRLQERGIGLLYVSHRLAEVFDLSGRITVLKDGRRVDHSGHRGHHRRPVGAAHGRPGALQLLPRPGRPRRPGPGAAHRPRRGKPEAARRQPRVARRRGARHRRPAGLRALGARPRDLRGVAVHDRRGHARRQAGPAALATHRDAGRHRLRHRGPQGRGDRPPAVGRSTTRCSPAGPSSPLRSGRAARTVRARELLAAVEVRGAGDDQEIRFLSGGNQQKVVLARWLALNPRILLFDEPTRGIDVGAKSAIHDLVRRLARDGAAVLMISSELPELLGMSDRIVVMRDGRIAGELPAGATEEDVVGLRPARDARVSRRPHRE